MKAVIVAGGEHDQGDEEALAGADLVIAADSGANWLDAIGVRPDRLVGDLDSADPAVVDRLRAAGVAVEQHPVDKDASDLELSLVWALRQGADEIVVLGWQGGAVDHLAANLLLLGTALPTGTTLRLSAGHTLARVIQGPGRLDVDHGPGARVSLLPLGPVDGVTTSGLHWPLEDAHLAPGSTLGLANRVDTVGATVWVESGQLLVIEIADNEGGAS